jgi:hypothetical protein
MPLPVEIKELFLLTLYGDKTELEFEEWLYQDSQLEKLLSSEDYLDLISHGYRIDASPSYELARLLEKHLEKGEAEKWRLLRLLSKALKRDVDLPGILVQFYDLYCAGYSFLDTLGLQYGLAVAVPYGYALSWDSITVKEQTKIIQGFYPQLETEIHKTISWLSEDLVVLTGAQDENGNYGFIDNRKFDAKTTVISATIMKPRRWWKFW